MGIKGAFDIIGDKRFSWRFKLANLILGDDLRLNLAFAKMRLENALDYVEKSSELSKKNIVRAIRDIDELWRYPEL